MKINNLGQRSLAGRPVASLGCSVTDDDEPWAALARPSLRRCLRLIQTSSFQQTFVPLQR
jgi:hypothetical protein